jgi:hypothetical protein
VVVVFSLIPTTMVEPAGTPLAAVSVNDAAALLEA